MEDNQLVMWLLRQRRWYLEEILDGTIDPSRKPEKPRLPRRRTLLSRVNAEIARRVGVAGDTDGRTPAG